MAANRWHLIWVVLFVVAVFRVHRLFPQVVQRRLSEVSPSAQPRQIGLQPRNRGWQEMPVAKRLAVQKLTEISKPWDLPSGSYASSCRDCVMEGLSGAMLRCMCEDGHGSRVSSAMDVSRCKHVENDHGTLLCKKNPTVARQKFAIGSDGTFAQNYQDTWVMRLAAANNWIQLGSKGTFMDIGAFNGDYCSNSKLLESILGWQGVCVEPFPDNPQSPSERSFENRSCVLMTRALTGLIDGRTVEMRGGSDAQSMQLDLDKVQLRSDKMSRASLGQVVAAEGRQVGSTQTISVHSLFRCTNSSISTSVSNMDTCTGRRGMPIVMGSLIHFVSLDVEGLEFDVLQAWPFEAAEVGAWIVEHNMQEPKRSDVKRLLQSQGYKWRDVENNGVDDYFVMDKYWPGDQLLRKAWRHHPSGSHNC